MKFRFVYLLFVDTGKEKVKEDFVGEVFCKKKKKERIKALIDFSCKWLQLGSKKYTAGMTL